MTSFDKHDLNWLAFRYVAGEMSGDESGEFETRLADDQAAREAVASAVELTQTISSAAVVSEFAVAAQPRNHAVGSRAVRGRRLLWLALGAAACLTLVVLLRDVFDVRHVANPNQHPNSAQRARDAQPQQLALVWSQTRQAEDHDAGVDDDSDEETAPIDDVTSTEDRSLPPSWIVAAITELDKTPRSDRDPADDLEEF